MFEDMSAAVFGQCGSPIPYISSHSETCLLDKVSCLHADRHAELQSLWQEMGDDNWQKLQELSQTVSKAVDEIYRKVVAESRRRKLDVQERVRKSEACLKEHMGCRALQVIAPTELPLLARLKMNLGCLEGLYICTEQSLLLTRLCTQVSALKGMLQLSPCINTRVDEVLTNSKDALHVFFSETSAAHKLYLEHGNDYPALIQLLHQFNMTLRAVEADLLFMKATRKLFEAHYRRHETSTGVTLQDSREIVARKRSLDHKTALASTCNASKECCTKPASGSSACIDGKESQLVRLVSDDSSTLEMLGHKILKKLERISRQVKCAIKHDVQVNGRTMPVSLSFSWDTSVQSSENCILMDMLPCSKDMKVDMQTSVVVSSIANRSSSLSISESSSSKLQYNNIVECAHMPCEDLDIQGQSNHADAYQTREYDRALWNGASMPQDSSLGQSQQSHVNMNETTETCLHAINEPDKELASVNRAAIKRLPLIPITNNQTAPAPTGKSSSQLFYPPPPPPPPPPPHVRHRQGALAPPPPPPPPPPSSTISKEVKVQPNNSASLKKSTVINRLYMEMKKKSEGVASVQSIAANDAAVQRKAIASIGTRESMAEALAEITRRSEYFRKIEDDVNKQASSILYVKFRLETFETYDMNELLQFRRSIEVHLEQLTDESQVLSRFEGFPIRKLEAVRAAASLHLRLTSLMEQAQNWVVEPPLFEHLEKVTVFFDKVKTEVEAIERTKDEELKRFTSQKIHFNFEPLNGIKEAVVHLSSKCLASALKESRNTQKSTLGGSGEALASTKDMNKQRVSFQMLYRTFLLAYRVHNFAGGHDEMAEQFCSELACEMEAYPSSFWMERIH